MTGPTATASPFRSRGFTLIEIVVVLVIVSVLISMAAMMTRGVVAAQKRALTSTRLAALDQALAQYVSQQKRLPCPADGTLGPGSAGLGTEGARNANGCTGNQKNGVVPFRALGLTEFDALDGWTHRITYRVDSKLTADNGMDLSFCDPAGTAGVGAGPPNQACQVTCTSPVDLSKCTPPSAFLQNKGLQVNDAVNPPPAPPLMNPSVTPNTGAAYVLISAGESGGGAYLPSGTKGLSSKKDGNEEKNNYADLQIGAYYVDGDIVDDDSGTAHFDDVVSRPTILTVASRAGLGPRAHY